MDGHGVFLFILADTFIQSKVTIYLNQQPKKTYSLQNSSLHKKPHEVILYYLKTGSPFSQVANSEKCFN